MLEATTQARVYTRSTRDCKPSDFKADVLSALERVEINPKTKRFVASLIRASSRTGILEMPFRQFAATFAPGRRHGIIHERIRRLGLMGIAHRLPSRLGIVRLQVSFGRILEIAEEQTKTPPA